MSITAFPVLVRILEDRQMVSTPLVYDGLADAGAAAGDVFAWVLLAVALTLIPHNGESVALFYRLIGLCVYVVVMLGVARPLGKWLVKRGTTDKLSYELLGVVVAFVLTSAAATEAIGVHPLFGAFMAGACLPAL